MQDELDENAQLEVEISNLIATESEYQKLKASIESGLGNNMSPITITSMSNIKDGTRYEISFRVFDPKRFRLEKVQDWLYEVGLVGWRLNGTFVRPEE